MKKKLMIYKDAYETIFIGKCNDNYVSRSTAFTLVITDFYKRYFKTCMNPTLLKKTCIDTLEFAKNFCSCNYFATTLSLNKGVNAIFTKLKTYFDVSNSDLYLMLVAFYVRFEPKTLDKMLSRANESNRYLLNLGIQKNLKGRNNVKRI